MMIVLLPLVSALVLIAGTILVARASMRMVYPEDNGIGQDAQQAPQNQE